MAILSIFPKGGGSLSSGGSMSYTGNYLRETVTMDGTDYDLWTLTSSGVLTASGTVVGDICICGGGSGGAPGGSGSYSSGCGGNGGFVNNYYNRVITSGNIIIGAGGGQYSSGGATEYDSLILKADGGLVASRYNSNYGAVGGSGGGLDWAGDSYSSYVNQGQGTTTRPFGSAEMQPLGAGGGAGSCNSRAVAAEKYTKGGTGGTDGGNGGAPYESSDYLTTGGIGGTQGGGIGGGANTNMNGTNGTYYGAGGGGGGFNYLTSGNSVPGSGGSGYAGVVMIRIPIS